MTDYELMEQSYNAKLAALTVAVRAFGVTSPEAMALARDCEIWGRLLDVLRRQPDSPR